MMAKRNLFSLNTSVLMLRNTYIDIYRECGYLIVEEEKNFRT